MLHRKFHTLNLNLKYNKHIIYLNYNAYQALTHCVCTARFPACLNLNIGSKISVLPPTTLKLHMKLHPDEFNMPHPFLGH